MSAAEKCAAACKAATTAALAEIYVVESAERIVDTAKRKDDQAHKFVLAA